LRNGSETISDPVAIKMFLVLMVLTLPSAAVTSTSLADLMLPTPGACVTLFFLNKPAMPLVKPVTALSLDFIMAGRSILTPSTVQAKRNNNQHKHNKYVNAGTLCHRTHDSVFGIVVRSIVVQVRGMQQSLHSNIQYPILPNINHTIRIGNQSRHLLETPTNE
jgi:hypothetical protein